MQNNKFTTETVIISSQDQYTLLYDNVAYLNPKTKDINNIECFFTIGLNKYIKYDTDKIIEIMTALFNEPRRYMFYFNELPKDDEEKILKLFKEKSTKAIKKIRKKTVVFQNPQLYIYSF